MGALALVRTEAGDVKVPCGGDVEPGDLVERRPGEPLRRVRAYLSGDYPTPDTELARLDRRRKHLVERSRALAAIRGLFAARDFVEVETPLRVRAPALEVQLHAVPAGDGEWLITSPEYQMKRLLAGGFERIYQVCKCFRGHEDGHQHAPEFTMLEWYRAWAGLDDILDDTEALVAEVARAVRGEPVVVAQGRRIPVDGAWPRLTVAEAMATHAGVTVRGDEPVEELAAAVTAAGIDLGGAVHWDDVFFAAFVERVEPALAAMDRPVFVTDWPVRLAALARRKPGNPAVVERFEAYVGGLELANAFGELTDPVEQRARFEDDLAARAARGLPAYPLDERLLAALTEGLPPCAGIALGIDRLVMLATGADHIRDVLTFAHDER
ncbi:MAG: EF-P lysine aminoacylase GenX [Kofleriaceae bacterium]|nr:EF-P lysine aminoacylase GenX [Kofleriaceae bacterium]